MGDYVYRKQWRHFFIPLTNVNEAVWLANPCCYVLTYTDTSLIDYTIQLLEISQRPRWRAFTFEWRDDNFMCSCLLQFVVYKIHGELGYEAFGNGNERRSHITDHADG